MMHVNDLDQLFAAYAAAVKWLFHLGTTRQGAQVGVLLKCNLKSMLIAHTYTYVDNTVCLHNNNITLRGYMYVYIEFGVPKHTLIHKGRQSAAEATSFPWTCFETASCVNGILLPFYRESHMYIFAKWHVIGVECTYLLIYNLLNEPHSQFDKHGRSIESSQPDRIRIIIVCKRKRSAITTNYTQLTEVNFGEAIMDSVASLGRSSVSVSCCCSVLLTAHHRHQ